MSRLFNRFIPLLVAASVYVSAAAAATDPQHNAPADYTLRAWHVSDGLPSDEIGSLMQDEKGYLWVTTTGGLVRFDGTGFEPAETPPEISQRGMIYQPPAMNSTGRLIALGNANGNTDGNTPGDVDGVYLRDHDGFVFERESQLAEKNVRSVFTEKNGVLWLGCEDGTVLRRQGSNTQRFETPAGLVGRKIPAFATDGDGKVWVVINTFVARFDGSRWIPLPVDHGSNEVRIASSRTGGPWLFTTEAALKWNGEKLDMIAPLSELQGSHFIQAAIEDRYGKAWIGTRSQGLFRISPRQVLAVPTSHEDIYSLCEDADGGIWAGTNGGGLNRLRPKAYQLFDKESGLKDNFSSTVTEDAKGVIWLANRDGGVVRIIDGKADPISRRMNWRQFSAMSVYPAAKGGVWITSGIGVYRTNALYPERLDRVRSLDSFKIVRSTFVAKNGDYWLSVDPESVVRWRDDDVRVFSAADGFDGREVRGFAEDSSGTLWVGAADGRLFRFDGERFVRVPLPGAENCGSLQTMRFEEDGTLLIATTLAGVLIVTPGETLQVRVLGTEQGLPNSNVTQILTDDSGRYWFASRRGIFRVDRDQLRDFASGKAGRVHAILLGKDDGLTDLSSLGLFQPAAWKARDGGLWFATRRGMLRLDPALTSGDSGPPPVTLSAISFDGRSQPVGSSIEIPSSVRKTEIRFSALSLSAPDQILVRHRLDGFDNDWVVQTSGRSATYPRLPPGKYVFRVSASNGSGIWSEQDVVLPVLVVPLWWQSTWANVLYFAALTLVIFACVRIWAHRRLRLRLEGLERERAIERERTRIAQNIHDDLGASLTHISLLTQLAQHENPGQAASFEKIYDAAHAITRSMDEIVWAVNPKCDDLESLVYYVGNFAQSFFSAAGIRCRLDVPAMLPSVNLTSQARHNLFLCCKEALNNVARHSHAGEVALTFAVDKNSLQITIADNGRGLAAGKLAQSADPFRISSGNGLKNIRQRIEELGGTCTFGERPGGGTLVTFLIVLPKPQN
ncbi:MAG: two-component regulator propeller domain-containing protein [Nibricoccus sp.]